MSEVDFRAPGFALFAPETEVHTDITQHIKSVEWEHTLDMASMLTIEAINPDFSISDSTIFQPGNELELHLGYGNDLSLVGRAEIVRHLPRFPSGDDIATIEIKGYDRSYLLMNKDLLITRGGKDPEKKKRKRTKEPEGGTTYDGTLESILKEILGEYDIVPSIDDDLKKTRVSFLQKKGTSDYTIIQGLANIFNAEFFVHFEPLDVVRGNARAQWVGRTGTWQGIFTRRKHPQNAVYTFRYGQGELSTLFSIDLEWGLPQFPSQIQCWVFDRASRDWIQVVEEEKPDRIETKFSPGTFASGGALSELKVSGVEAGELTSLTEVKIAAEDSSIEVLTRPFESAEQAARFAKDWFQRHRDAFIIANGSLPGLETLAAGQTHKIEGLGRRYSGEYYFSKVKHRFDDSGYITEFSARKIISE